MWFLILLGFAGWPFVAYINGRFRRRRPVADAIWHAFLWLLVALHVGITLIDVYIVKHVAQPDGALTSVLLYLSILWFTLPYITLCLWLVCQRFGRRATHPNDA